MHNNRLYKELTKPGEYCHGNRHFFPFSEAVMLCAGVEKSWGVVCALGVDLKLDFRGAGEPDI